MTVCRVSLSSDIDRTRAPDSPSISDQSPKSHLAPYVADGRSCHTAAAIHADSFDAGVRSADDVVHHNIAGHARPLYGSGRVDKAAVLLQRSVGGAKLAIAFLHLIGSKSEGVCP